MDIVSLAWATLTVVFTFSLSLIDGEGVDSKTVDTTKTKLINRLSIQLHQFFINRFAKPCLKRSI